MTVIRMHHQQGLIVSASIPKKKSPLGHAQTWLSRASTQAIVSCALMAICAVTLLVILNLMQLESIHGRNKQPSTIISTASKHKQPANPSRKKPDESFLVEKGDRLQVGEPPIDDIKRHKYPANRTRHPLELEDDLVAKKLLEDSRNAAKDQTSRDSTGGGETLIGAELLDTANRTVKDMIAKLEAVKPVLQKTKRTRTRNAELLKAVDLMIKKNKGTLKKDTAVKKESNNETTSKTIIKKEKQVTNETQGGSDPSTTNKQAEVSTAPQETVKLTKRSPDASKAVDGPVEGNGTTTETVRKLKVADLNSRMDQSIGARRNNTTTAKTADATDGGAAAKVGPAAGGSKVNNTTQVGTVPDAQPVPTASMVQSTVTPAGNNPVNETEASGRVETAVTAATITSGANATSTAKKPDIPAPGGQFP